MSQTFLGVTGERAVLPGQLVPWFQHGYEVVWTVGLSDAHTSRKREREREKGMMCDVCVREREREKEKERRREGEKERRREREGDNGLRRRQRTGPITHGTREVRRASLGAMEGVMVSGKRLTVLKMYLTSAPCEAHPLPVRIERGFHHGRTRSGKDASQAVLMCSKT